MSKENNSQRTTAPLSNFKMHYSDIISLIYRIIKIKYFNGIYPIVVRWDITTRCPLSCKYCRLWTIKMPEFTTDQIFRVIKDLAKIGIRKICFSGGEPLLREDICEIIKYAYVNGISPEMNSSGFGFSEKAQKLTCLDLLKLSLDGPPEINDEVRGKKGAFQWTIDAAKCAKKNKIKFVFCTTLTGYNIEHLDYMLQIAKEFKTQVRFQPLKNIKYLEHSGFLNPEDNKLLPSRQHFKRAIDMLISHREASGTLVSNSLKSLKHIYNWPRYEKLKCWSGKVFFTINPAGKVSPCDRIYYETELPNCSEISIEQAIIKMPRLPPCDGCGFLGSLALNYLMNFKLDLCLLKNIAITTNKHRQATYEKKI